MSSKQTLGRLTNKRVNLSIGVNKDALKKKIFSRSVSYQRQVTGFGKPFVQNVAYEPRKGVLRLSIAPVSDSHNPVSTLTCVFGTFKSKGTFFRKKFAEINSAWTNPEFEGNGLNVQLMSEAVELLKSKGFKKIFSQVTTHHQNIYTKLGFKCTARTPDGDFYSLDL